MSISWRWLGTMVLSVVGVLGLSNTPVHAQLSGGLGFRGPGAGGLGAGGLSFAGLGAGGLGGYGSLLRGGIGGRIGGGIGGFGLAGGIGTQWMMNPYQGYLQGAASITNANARYQVTINQAKLLRQEAIRSAFQTRRAAIEQAEYERAHMPDPEKIRQDHLARELDHARVSPPLTEVWSGKSLNVLLRNAIAQQMQGGRGPNVPLSEDALKSINLTAGDTRGNIGLLKDNGNLKWPQALAGGAFKEAREDLSRRIKQAFNTVQLNRGPDESTLSDLQVDLKRLNATLDVSVDGISPDQYIESKRYLEQVGNAVTALKDRNASNYFNGNWTAKGKTVAELVKHMGEKGLWFAPATPSDVAAYLSLYHALAAFDAGMPRVVTTSDSNKK